MTWSGVITNAGVTLFNTGGTTGPLVNVDGFVLGDGFNYTPTQSQTNLNGSVVYTSSSPTELRYLIASNDTVIFRILLDSSAGALTFGEVALKSGSTLVSINVNDTIISKNANSLYQLDVALKLANISDSINVDINTQDVAILPTVTDETQLPANSTSVPYNAYRFLDTTTSPTTRAGIAVASGTSWMLLTAPAPNNIYQQIRTVTSTTMPTQPENMDMVRVSDLDDGLFMYNSTLGCWVQQS